MINVDMVARDYFYSDTIFRIAHMHVWCMYSKEILDVPIMDVCGFIDKNGFWITK